MGDLSIQINPRLMQRVGASMFGFKDYLQRLTRDMLKQEAALCARQFMKFSPPIPYGGGDSDTLPGKKQGNIAVERDIRSVIVPRDSNLAASVDDVYGGLDSFNKWKAKQLRGNVGSIIRDIHDDNNIPRAFQAAKNLFSKHVPGDRLLGSSGLDRPHDKQRKMYRGRITRNRGPSQDVKKQKYFADPVALDDYIKKRQEMVGKLNSGWWTVIQRVGKVHIRGMDVAPASKGIPQWISRHKTAGYVNTVSRDGGIRYESITIVNPIGDIMGVATDANTKTRVIIKRMNMIASRPYERILRRSISEFTAGKTNFK